MNPLLLSILGEGKSENKDEGEVGKDVGASGGEAEVENEGESENEGDADVQGKGQGEGKKKVMLRWA